jgi:hypothetical protein
VATDGWVGHMRPWREKCTTSIIRLKWPNSRFCTGTFSTQEPWVRNSPSHKPQSPPILAEWIQRNTQQPNELWLLGCSKT